MTDFGEVVGDGFATGSGMLWAALTANPWVALLFAGIVVGALWLQLTTPARLVQETKGTRNLDDLDLHETTRVRFRVGCGSPRPSPEEFNR